MPFHVASVLTAIAVIFLGAILGGRLASLCRVPRITGYLLTGLLAGPSFAELLHLPALISPATLDQLQVLADVTLALILMNIGGQFRIEHLRRWKSRIMVFSLCESGMTFLLVGCGALLVNYFLLQQVLPGFNLWQTSLFFALFLGIISIATAPAATLMVIREYEAEGPITNTVLALVGLNNLLSVLAFTVAAHFVLQPDTGLLELAYRTLGPLAVGSLMAFGLSIWTQRLEQKSEFKLLALGGVMALLGICFLLHLDPLLASLTLGIVWANSSPRWQSLHDAVREIDYPLYVVFFVIAGANLHLETLAHLGLLGLCYVLLRSAGKIAGANLGARLAGFGEREQRFIGMTLLAQAGVAIGLATNLCNQCPKGGPVLESVVLGSVVIFELIGPLAVRRGLVSAGEVPILSLLSKRTPQGTLEGFHSVVQHFRTSLGLPAGHRLRDPGDILVRHVMRQNVETILNSTPFHELLRQIAHSRYDRFPVVDPEGRFLGLINYQEIRNLLFEPSLAQLVVASDLVSSSRPSLAPDQPLRDALKVLEHHRNISYFPVIDPDEPQRLLGILSQNDVLAAFRQLGQL